MPALLTRPDNPSGPAALDTTLAASFTDFESVTSRKSGVNRSGPSPRSEAASDSFRTPAKTRQPSLSMYNAQARPIPVEDRKSTRLNSSHQLISYAVLC